MWKAAAGAKISVKDQEVPDDDWETDPDFINDVTEEEQRWGSATIVGSGRSAGAIDMAQLRKETEQADANKKKKDLEEGPNASFGYGGKFGVEADRMDQSAVGHDYVGKVEKHSSQQDYSTGFGGKYGVQKDRVDKSAVSWDHKEKIEKHGSQKDYSTGFGGKYGVQSDRQDKSALGWDHVEKIEKHESQKDYSRGFGGKYGVQADRQDKSAVGWDHHEAPQKHESQTDHKIGFGGKFGVQTDRMDKSAVTFNEEPARVGTTYTKTRPEIGDTKPSQLRAKFENMGAQENVQSTTALPPRKNIQAKAAIFNVKKTDPQVQPSPERVIKQLDQSKTAFLKQTVPNENSTVAQSTPGQLDQMKISQFTAQNVTTSSENIPVRKLNEELEQLKQMQQPKLQETEITAKVQKTKNVEQPIVEAQPAEPVSVAESVQEVTTHDDEIVDTGFTAVALYDYQAGAEDEISFDPDDVITHVEMIDEGWWRGMCKGRYGLFPANYVQLQQ